MPIQKPPNDFPTNFRTILAHDSKPIPRFSDVSLPNYSYVPRLFPHPIREPTGHSFGKQEPQAVLEGETLWHCDNYMKGIDLFNHGYYWESHETWESVWHALGRTTTAARFVQGWIKLAAAGVKAREGNKQGIERHAARAAELFEQSRDLGDAVTGFYASEVFTTATWIQANSDRLVNSSPAKVEIVMPFLLSPICTS